MINMFRGFLPVIISLSAVVLFVSNVLCQDYVGIGMGGNLPTRAMLEVPSVPSGSSTGVIFGSGSAGISLQRSWPTIGFNQYRDDVFSPLYGKYMTNGPAATISMNHNTGFMYFDLFPSGTANTDIASAVRVMTIAPSGNVSIMSTSTEASLTVVKGSNTAGSVVIEGDSTLTIFHESAAERISISASRPSKTLFVNYNSGGDVLIGSTLNRVAINRPNQTAAATIDINQPNTAQVLALRQTDNFNNSWGQRVSFTGVPSSGNNLWLYYNDTAKSYIRFNDGLIYQASDARLKTAVRNVDPVLEKVKQLQPVHFTMKADKEFRKRQMGFVAQEVKNLFPLLVREFDNGERNGNHISDLNALDYSGFGVVAIKALQEQWQQIKQLEQEQADLLQRLTYLEKLQ